MNSPPSVLAPKGTVGRVNGRRLVRWAGLVALALILAAGPQAKASLINFVGDYSETSNPNGAWAYGWWDNAPTTFTIDQQYYSGSTPYWAGPIWGGGVYFPILWRNDGAAAVDGVQPGQVSLHPAPAGQFSDVRWTAPPEATGTANLAGQFYPGDVGIMSLYIIKNGDWSNPLWTGVDSGTFDLTVPIAPGNTVDFAVGTTTNYFNGNTPLDVSITATPEPATLALLALGGLGIMGRAVKARRR